MGSGYLENTAATIDQWFVELQRLVKNWVAFSQNYPRCVRVLTEKVSQPIEILGAANGFEPSTLTLARPTPLAAIYDNVGIK